jgi:hypothetical protein
MRGGKTTGGSDEIAWKTVGIITILPRAAQAGFNGVNATSGGIRASVAAGTQRLTDTDAIIRENGKGVLTQSQAA